MGSCCEAPSHGAAGAGAAVGARVPPSSVPLRRFLGQMTPSGARHSPGSPGIGSGMQWWPSPREATVIIALTALVVLGAIFAVGRVLW
jgi:hypothetical protein